MFGNFFTFLRFELGFWLKSMMVWVFLTIITLFMLLLLMQDNPALEDLFFSRARHNSAFAIQRLYATTAVFGCLMVTAFVNAAASRDFAYNTQQLIFTKPISKLSYLMGRFVGSVIVSMVPMLGASLAVIIAEQFQTEVTVEWGPSQWWAHVWSIFVIALPNTLVIASIVFAIAVWTRSALASFLGILAFIVLVSIAQTLAVGLDSKFIAAMLDPFGDTAIDQMTQYWTIADKNTQTVGLVGSLLWNRVVWLGIGAFAFIGGYFGFSFSTSEGFIGKWFRIAKDSLVQPFLSPYHTTKLPVVRRHFGAMSTVQKWLHLVLVESWHTMRSPIFICMLFGVLFVSLTNFSMQSSPMFGVPTLPVTFNMVDVVRGSLMQFQLVVITFYAGVFVWKERDAKLDEIYDALPIPTGLTFLAKLSAMMFVIAAMMVIGIICGVLFQLLSGYFNVQLGLYFQELLGWDMVELFCLVVLAFFCHVVSPNKYVGYFLFIGLFVANVVVWGLLEVRSNMFQYADLPNYVYSDMFGRAPYAIILRWFAAYWLLFATMILLACIALWPRGRERGAKQRFAQVLPRFKGGLRFGTIGVVCAWLATASWIFWNTQVINELEGRQESKQAQADYEKQWKAKADEPQPRITKVRYEIDLFPAQRRLQMRGDQVIENRNDVPVEKIYLMVDDTYDVEVDIEGAKRVDIDEQLGVWTYEVQPVMRPGEQRQMKFNVEYAPKGFENSLGVSSIVQNGTFFNNMIAPQIGYQAGYELKEQEDRKEFGLSQDTNFPALDPKNLKARSSTYISNNSDWVDVETVISTSADQIAVAPGSLIDVETKGDRKYFHYKLDHPSMNFYSFVSARFEVATREFGDVSLEVYYHPDHKWNVDGMLRAMKDSLQYYTKAFGPYKHKQARIVEFPRVAQFAQAFPGTMPYSEGIGFIADLSDKDQDIDMVYYVVAHEMAHQWWAHQVIGANMRGSTVLSETLAQYSALMVMEQTYGRDMMRKFLQHEMNDYLRARGRTDRPERPLKEVEFDQGYIHYNKGSLAMYLLRETIGEEKVNEALQSLIDQFAYQGPPYPTSLDLVAALRKVTPEEHQTVIDDVFDYITLFDNRTEQATYRKIGKDKYEVTIDVTFRKVRADDEGHESEIRLDDWIEIGAFAKPNGTSKFGETLYRERFQITEDRRSFTFEVDKLPNLVGVDPISLLIDRNKEDNMKTPTKQE